MQITTEFETAKGGQVASNDQLGTLKNRILSIHGDFEQGEKVFCRILSAGNFEIKSLDGTKVGYAGDFEVDLSGA